jgi:hypothetical protein
MNPPTPEHWQAILDMVDAQANHAPLWPLSKDTPILCAYIAQELRRLHEVIEGKTQAEVVREIIKEMY